MLAQLTQRCFYLPGDHATDRPSLGYIRGNHFSLLVDGGNSPAHQHLMQDALAAAALPTPSLAAVTHSHWDHVYGLCATDAVVIACERTQKQLLAMQGWQWSKEAMVSRLQSGEDILFCHENILREYADPAVIRVRSADLVFDRQMSLDLGGVHAELQLLENSHAEDCVIVYLPEEKVVYLGDITYEDLHHNPPCWHVQQRAALLGALDRLDFDWAVPGHQDAMHRDVFFRDMESAFAQDRESGKLLLPD